MERWGGPIGGPRHRGSCVLHVAQPPMLTLKVRLNGAERGKLIKIDPAEETLDSGLLQLRAPSAVAWRFA